MIGWPPLTAFSVQETAGTEMYDYVTANDSLQCTGNCWCRNVLLCDHHWQYSVYRKLLVQNTYECTDTECCHSDVLLLCECGWLQGTGCNMDGRSAVSLVKSLEWRDWVVVYIDWIYLWNVQCVWKVAVRLGYGTYIWLSVSKLPLKCAVVSLYSVVKQRLKCNTGKVCDCLIQFLLTMVLSVDFKHLL
jgi:hypothetical protein